MPSVVNYAAHKPRPAKRLTIVLSVTNTGLNLKSMLTVVLVVVALVVAACGGTDQTIPSDITVVSGPAGPTTLPAGGSADPVPAETGTQPPVGPSGNTALPVETTTFSTHEPTADTAQPDSDGANDVADTVEPVVEETGEESPSATVPDDQADAPAETEGDEATTDDAGPPVRMVVREGITYEDTCTVSGGTWTDGECIGTLWDAAEEGNSVVFWYPMLMDDAYQSADLDSAGAGYRESRSTGAPWGTYRYLVFYHFNGLEEQELQLRVMRETIKFAVRSVFAPVSDWVYFPHRYDVAWSEDPNFVNITGTYPLGEQRTLMLNIDPKERGAANIELPLAPPIRPTTPFTEPQWPDTAHYLGRNCPPVEEIWDGYRTEVTDPCTLKAVEFAVDWMWTGDATYRQRAIRDGRALADFLQQIDSIEDRLAPPVVVGDRPLLVVKYKRPHGGGVFYYGTAGFVRGALSDRGAG